MERDREVGVSSAKQMILRSNSRKLYLVQQQVLTGKVAEKQTVETLDSGRFCVLISASSKPLLLDPVLNQSSMLKALAKPAVEK